MRGGKRIGAGRPKKSEEEKAKRYTFRLYEWQVQIVKDFIKKLKEEGKTMKKILLLILLFGFGVAYAANETYDINSGSQIGNTYYKWNNETNSYDSYKKQDNHIYGSDGSHYYQMNDNIINDMNNGSLYQINGNTVEQIY